MKPVLKNIQIKKLSEGAYGCVFRPGIECDGKIMQTDDYITKIQKKKRFSRYDNSSITEKEVKIGNKIKKITNYADFFAPIVESCPISISKMSNQGELKKCELIDNEMTGNKIPEEFDSNKIKYAGKNSLSDYLLSKKSVILKSFIEKQIDILESLQLLYDSGVIHFDLKENNIICKDKTGAPVIIDFGLSIDIDELNTYSMETLGKFFYVYAPDYGPWCIDICVISYIANKLDATRRLEKITQPEISNIILEFINTNGAINKLLDSIQKESLKKTLTEYFAPFITKPWKDLVDELLKYKHTWDNYSLAIIYLFLYYDLYLDTYESKLNQLVEYKALLLSMILLPPPERSPIGATIEKIKAMFSNIKKTDLYKMGVDLKSNVSDIANLNKIKKNLGQSKIISLQQHDALFSIINTAAR
jgi:serine/threonine protein kinase